MTGINDGPVVTDIPGEIIAEGGSFATINLDDYVSDIDDDDSTLTWTYTGDVNLTVDITNRVATITATAEWNGDETITFRATDDSTAFDEDAATFTVTGINDAPVVAGISDQTIAEGGSFTSINLDDYVADPDNTDDQITWSTATTTNITVTISADRKATITANSADWTGSETVSFTAQDPDGLNDTDSATFIVTDNDPPIVSDIPDESIAEGSSFTMIKLDDYVTDGTNNSKDDECGDDNDTSELELEEYSYSDED